MAINVDSPPPASWSFGSGTINTINEDKFLATRLCASRSPRPHFQARLHAARGQFSSMKSAGLLGGHHTGAQSSMLASTCIWPVLNAGRPAVALHEHTPEAEAIRSSLDEFRRKVGAHILGVPTRAPVEGILGELGWPTDMDLANAQHLRLFENFMREPHISLPLGFMQRLLQLNTCTPHLSPPFVQHAMQLISAYGLSVGDAALPCWKDQVRRASDVLSAVALPCHVHAVAGSYIPRHGWARHGSLLAHGPLQGPSAPSSG